MQKAAVAGVPVVAAVGAPSNWPGTGRWTVLEFVRHDRFYVYTGSDHIGED